MSSMTMNNSKWLACVAIIVAMMMAGPREARGVTIVLKGSDKPIYGFVVKEEPTQILVRQVTLSGSRVVPIQRKDIEFINQPYDVDRLVTLSPDQPDAYRRYAEELVEQKVDPEARELATRLFLLAAYWDGERLGRSCLLGLSDLATTASQKERCRALAYLMDTEHDRSLLEDVVEERPQVEEPESNQKTALRTLVVALERGRVRQAQGIAKRSSPQALLASYQQFLTPEELELALATPENGEFSKVLRTRLLRLRYELIAQDLGSRKRLESRPTRKWHIALLNPDNQEPVRSLTLEGITPYDPQQCLYRDGEWVRSSSTD
ncbi:MAG: hypothetical protein ABGX22_07145 [Pirellulaceae bacterium]